MNGGRHLEHEALGAGPTDRRLVNPFTDWSHKKLLDHAEDFIKKSGLKDYREHFRKGASLAQSRKLFDNEKYDGMELDPIEREALGLEFSENPITRFKQPIKLYLLVACCSLGAAVQGWYV